MANLRKLIAAALSGSNLSASEIVETAVDRIAAMAHTDTLGAELWRLQLSYDRGAYRRALALLVKRCKPVAKNDVLRRRLCDTVLQEWLDTNCRACGGRGFVMAEGVAKRTCTVCDGSALRRYSDQWRMTKMKFDRDTYRKWERRFALVHQKIANADAAAWRGIATSLGWIGKVVEADVLAFYREHAIIRAAVSDGPAQTQYNNMPEFVVSSATGTE